MEYFCIPRVQIERHRPIVGGSRVRSSLPSHSSGTPMDNHDNGAAVEAGRGAGVDDSASKQTRARRPKAVIGTAQPGTLPKAWLEMRNKNRLGVRVNFHKLDTEALLRYRKFYKLPEVGPDATKEQLVLAVGKHFMGQQIDETRAISMFLKTARQQGDGK